jgi:hypothetical protein
VKGALERLSSFVLRPSSFIVHEERLGSDLVGWRYAARRATMIALPAQRSTASRSGLCCWGR